jgi:hypothetical protein
MDQEIWDGNWRLADHDVVTGRSVWVTVQDGQTIARVDMPNDKLEDIFAVNHAFERSDNGEPLRRLQPGSLDPASSRPQERPWPKR